MINMNKKITMAGQSGFTLIELMISLVLGLLISAAAVQIYMVNYRVSSVQQSSSDLQSASIFGIQEFERHVRLANLGNVVSHIDDTTPKGGVVLTNANVGASPTVDNKYLTRSVGDTGWAGVSNISGVASDQLTIQFTNATGREIFNCEGTAVPAGGRVIERYFLREPVGTTSTATVKPLVLACDAGSITTSTTTTSGVTTSTTSVSNFGDNGADLIVGVDQFSVLLGTQGTGNTTNNKAGEMVYLPSSTYKGLTAPKPPIISVKLGLIVHGSTAIAGSEDQENFSLLGTTNQLKSDTARRKRIRTSYESTILLRNARVINVSVPSTSSNP